MARFKHRHEFGLEGSEGELNLVPYLDIMVNLVMFMLFTYQVIIDMNVIDLVTPAYGASTAAASTDEKKDITVNLAITRGGYTLLSTDDTMGRIDIGKKGADYDVDELRRKMIEWKDTYQLGESLVLMADKDIEYAHIVRAMDAVREDGGRLLFPNVLLAASGSGGAL